MKKLTAEAPESRSADLTTENIGRLKELFPEAFTEGKIDFEVLKQLLGGAVDERDEKYGLNWHGKRRARQLALTPSLGTLRPAPEESVDWNSTQNLLIEGDNLEVLKLLQKSYAGKVKLIYIDPPYNTGKDFVYPDDFVDGIKNYKELTGQTKGGKPVTSNVESSGRFHTEWLNMMYPRLKLAWSLLREDGFLFISIDDGEHNNLRSVCTEIFGEESFVGNIAWEKRTKAQNTETAREMLQSKTEYILVYKKSAGKARFKLIVSGIKEYDQSDLKGSYRLKRIELMSSLGMRGRETMRFPILGIDPPEGKQWKFGTDYIKLFEEREDLLLIESAPHVKIRPEDENEERFQPFWSLFSSKDVGTAESGKAQLNEILGTNAHGFETVKPSDLIKKLLYHSSLGDETTPDIILDFFAGSGTTPHAVMEQNCDDGRNRRWIAIQFPEICSPDSETYLAGFPTIFELTKSRVRAIASKLRQDESSPKLDLGFRVFKLDTSNIRPWNPDRNDLEQTLLDHAEHLVEGRSESDLLYELFLKRGIDLCAPIEQRKGKGIDSRLKGKDDIIVHSVGGGTLIACLTEQIDSKNAEPLAEGIVEWYTQSGSPKDVTCIFRDSAFSDNVAKSNVTAILEQNGIKNVRSL